MINVPNDFIRIVLSLPKKESKYKKAEISKIHKGDSFSYQLSLFTPKQAFHYNINEEEIEMKVNNLFNNEFNVLEIYTSLYIYGYKNTSKNKLLSNKRKNATNIVEIKEHNKKKKYILEGYNIPALIDLGVINKEGKIINSSYDKYRQINRYIEMLDDIIKDETKLRIIDFGCGKSYLTFIVYFYCKEIKNIDVEIVGIDLKEDVINNCNDLTKKYGYDKLKFVCGMIEDFKFEHEFDLIMTLHACDTATDYALYHAITNKIKYIYSVPCCQHEVNNSIDDNYLHIVNKFGLLKDRLSAILTDAIRANILQYYGYKTQILEFVDFDATPKNILIRATLTGSKNNKAKEEVDELILKTHAKQTLYELTIAKEE